MIRDYIKITEQDLKLAEDFFENDKHFNEWLVNVVRYYRGNKVEIKTKIVQKYFNNYKKTMDYILNSIGTGKKGAEVKAEKQAVKEDTLKGVVKPSLEQSLEPNIKTVIEKKEDKIENFKPPTIDMVISYFVEKGYSNHSAETAFNYYDVLGWKDKDGNQIKNWKLKMVSVWFKVENKIPAKKMVY